MKPLQVTFTSFLSLLALQLCQANPISLHRRSIDSVIDELLEIEAEAKEALSPPYHDPFKPRDSFDVENEATTFYSIAPTFPDPAAASSSIPTPSAPAAASSSIPTSSAPAAASSTTPTFPDPAAPSSAVPTFSGPAAASSTTFPDPPTTFSSRSYIV
ncbi:hypothetical protein L207DRAFT_580701 [Hyaloscypha variabilis F]|uniref:Uncharacterized protein n=1 Tax=Hyaloscypha variabilis (strain UAMH 11265 / GT02V1 / F) TaxID=1149755 RepID=A0A2J6RU31_HYAVF|nr:hypothetical protein L207DRAFT_580701 [Hyaloscypha variabilis F]